jgi:hypothetical protein
VSSTSGAGTPDSSPVSICTFVPVKLSLSPPRSPRVSSTSGAGTPDSSPVSICTFVPVKLSLSPPRSPRVSSTSGAGAAFTSFTRTKVQRRTQQQQL